MAFALAKITSVSHPDSTPVSVELMFNPGEYSVDRGAQYAEAQVLGLKQPILQFVRGEAQTLSVEILLDGTDARAPVTKKLSLLRRFVEIDSELHAPPVCRLEWGSEHFQGVVTSFRERYQLFDDEGNPLRVRIALSLKSYESVEMQLRSLNRMSPDHTRVRVVREGDTLASIAREAYGDPRLWRAIADANNITRPRYLTIEALLRVPAI